MAAIDYDQYTALVAAGDLTGAANFMNGAVAIRHAEATQTFVQLGLAQKQWASGSSLSIPTGGSVSAVLSPNIGLLASSGITFFDAAESANKFSGTLDVDQLGDGTITMTVTKELGAVANNTSWLVQLGEISCAELSGPLVLETEGGTGADTFAGARENLQVARRFSILSIVSDAPGVPNDGDSHLVRDGQTPGDPFENHENEIVVRSGGGWVFIVPGQGARIYDASQKKEYLNTGIAQFTGGLWGESFWVMATPETRLAVEFSASPAVLLTGSDLASRSIWKIGNGAAVTLTLPDPSGPGILGSELIVVLTTAGTATLNVTGGASINASPTYVLSSLYEAVTLIAFESGGGGRWLAIP